MQCPVDNETLVMTERQGVEIDYCPKCRGVWLDRGELDKIIERAAPASESYANRSLDEVAPPSDYQPRREYPREHGDEHYGRDSRGRHKREGFLGDLFDF